MAQTFHELRVAKKIQETADAVSLIFDIPADLADTFQYASGQYITIKSELLGEEIRRSYSICTAPHESHLQVNVKKVKNGRMSTYVVDQLKEGETLEIGSPEGNFIMTFDASKRRNHYFIAAGSGITPVMSLLKDGLEHEPLSTFVLLFGNKNEDCIIFKKEIEELKNQFGDQFKVFHALSQTKKSGKLFGLFGKNKNAAGNWSGRIDAKKMHQLLGEIPANQMYNHFYLCGPGEMITVVQKWIKEENIAGAEIHKEYFANPDQTPGQVLESQEAKMSFKNLHGQDGELVVPKGKSILEALMDEGHDPPYSCMNGVCSSCVAKLVKGNVEMDTCLALEDDEIAAGYILTCQAQCQTPEIEIEYEG